MVLNIKSTFNKHNFFCLFYWPTAMGGGCFIIILLFGPPQHNIDTSSRDILLSSIISGKFLVLLAILRQKPRDTSLLVVSIGR